MQPPSFDLFKAALTARVPLIQIRSDDIVNHQAVLDYISGEGSTMLPVPAEGGPSLTDVMSAPDTPSIYFSSNEGQCTPKLYALVRGLGKTVVFFNIKANNPLCLQAGTMMPPRPMVQGLLASHWGQEKADELVNCFGGLNLKEVSDVVLMVSSAFPEPTPYNVNKVRQSYISRLKGISQIDTDYLFYQEPPALKTWCAENSAFFVDMDYPGLTPKGLLLDGPPGTGKTMVAKFLARTWGVPLFRLDMGGVKEKYVGASEGNLLAALKQLDEVAPCVVLLDEVEKFFAAQSDHGVTTSLLGQLLWWLQERPGKVFVVMTTNNKSALPPELFREGRLDDVLVLDGIHSQAEAVKFCEQSVAHLCKDLGIDTPEIKEKLCVSMFSWIKGKVAAGPVTQAEVTNRVRKEAKRYILSSSIVEKEAA